MKKSLMVLALVGIMALGATFAMAQGYGRGMGYGGHGGGWGHGGGHGMGYGGCWNGGGYMAPGAGADGWGFGQAVEQITADGAKAKVKEFVDSNYKGYKIGDVSTQTSPRGFNMYFVQATDNSGNTFIFHVAPNGFVRGPMLESQYNQMLQWMNNVPAN